VVYRPKWKREWQYRRIEVEDGEVLQDLGEVLSSPEVMLLVTDVVPTRSELVLGSSSVAMTSKLRNDMDSESSQDGKYEMVGA
jgi:hypothetical protein